MPPGRSDPLAFPARATDAPEGPPLIERTSELALAPLLLAQGLYTLWRTPRLPEAAGERNGSAGSGPRLRLLVAGDSAAAGVGVARQEEALAGRLAARLAERFSVSWRLVARSGLTTAGVAGMVERSPAGPFDVAVVSAGVNDVTHRVRLAAWTASLDRLVATLTGRFGVGRILLSAVPPMHRFPALPQPLRWHLGRRAQRFNRRLADFVREREGCTLLPIPDVSAAGMMAADGFHPGAAAYAAWADAVAAVIRGQLEGKR